MKKILFTIALIFSLIFSFEADARFGRVGGFRHSGFRSHSYSRSVSRSTPKTSTTKATTTASTAKAKVDTAKSKAVTNASNTASTAKAKVDTAKSTVDTSKKTVTNTVVHEHYGSNAPLWFLIGHSTAHDKVTVINNTDEKFSCSDCESLKDEKEVYTACMKKCVK